MKWISTTNTSLIIIDICSRMLHTLEFVKLKGYGYTGHWSAVTRRASAVGTCSKVADSVTEFQCRVEKAIQPLNQSLTSHLSSSSHNAKLVCVCVCVGMDAKAGRKYGKEDTHRICWSHYQEHFNVFGTRYKDIDSKLLSVHYFTATVR